MEKWMVFGLTILGLGLVFQKDASATVMVGETAISNGVYINYTFNHGYYPRDWPYRYQMLADGMGQLRQTIFEILEMPIILVVMPDEVFGRIPKENSIEYKAKCLINRGDMGGGDVSRESGFECYEVNLNTNIPSWEGLVKVIMSLQNFDRGKKLTSVRLEDFASGNEEWFERLSKGFTKFKNYYNPEWSPDSRYVSALYWQDGKAGVEILYNNQVIARSETAEYPAHAPVWLENGKYLAYATLDRVVFWSSITNEFRYINYQAKNLEVLLKYDGKSGTLNLAADNAVLADYSLFKVNLENGEIENVPQKYDSLGWDRDKGIQGMNYFYPVVSNDGQNKLIYENKSRNDDDVLRTETGQGLPADATKGSQLDPKKAAAGVFDIRLVLGGLGLFLAGFALSWVIQNRRIRKFSPESVSGE